MVSFTNKTNGMVKTRVDIIIYLGMDRPTGDHSPLASIGYAMQPHSLEN